MITPRTITFLGTGAADATKYYHSCFYIRDEKTGLLVDTGGGGGILAQLEKASIPLEDIRFLFITHKHMDHLLGVFWVLRFLGSKIGKGAAEGLTIFASEKVIKVIRDISPVFLKEKITGLYDGKIQFKSINDEKEFSLGEWTVKPFNLQSKKEEQFGFRLTFGDGMSVVCLGDEPYKDELFKQCKEVDYFMHDAFCLERDRERFNPHDIHHATGGAVDVWLIQDGAEANLGVPFDWMEEEAGAFYHLKLSRKRLAGNDRRVCSNRSRIILAMADAGFSCYGPEFWHFNYGNQMDALVKGGYARYSYIEP